MCLQDTFKRAIGRNIFDMAGQISPQPSRRVTNTMFSQSESMPGNNRISRVSSPVMTIRIRKFILVFKKSKEAVSTHVNQTV